MNIPLRYIMIIVNEAKFALKINILVCIPNILNNQTQNNSFVYNYGSRPILGRF